MDTTRLRLHPDNKTKSAMQIDCEQAADEIDRMRAERDAAVAAEREACAKVCDGFAGTEANAETLAAAIRARGEVPE